MLGMALVEEMVKTSLLTGRVSNHGTHPVSLLLISPPEHGKTTMLMNSSCETMLLLNDVTGNGLREIVANHAGVTHIALLDLLMATSHKSKANQYLMANIAAVAEEGFIGEATPKGVKLMKEPVKKAFIICMTPSMAKDGRSQWNKSGITTRMLPFAYSFAEKLKDNVRASINFAPTRIIDIRQFKVPAAPISVQFERKQIELVDMLARAKSNELEDNTGFRRLKQFRALACAHALYRTWKKPRVQDEDVKFIERISPYISYTKGKEL